MGRRLRAKAIAAYSDQELVELYTDPKSEHSIASYDDTTRLYLRVDDPENITDEFKQRLGHLFQRTVSAQAAAKSEATPKTNVVICASPYASQEYMDAPWESHLLTTISPQTFHSQDQSPLFKLSAELRLQIFTFALAEYENWDREYDPHDEPDVTFFCNYYRPGWMAPWAIDVALLYTCRRIYYEAAHLPMRLATHRFCYDMPTPRNEGMRSDFMKIGGVRIENLTRHNLDNVTRMKIQASPHFLKCRTMFFEEWESYRGPDPFPNLQYLTIIIPWSGWDPYFPGELDLGEVECNDWPEIKRRLRLEFEVPHDDHDSRSRLNDIRRKLRGGLLKFKTINGTPLVLDLGGRTGGKWQFQLPDGILGSDYAQQRFVDEPEPNFLIAFVDYVPGRPPALWADIRDAA